MPAREVFADIEAFKDYVLSFGIFAVPDEGRHYVDAHFRRFRSTVARIPPGRGALLEIGAAPFCMTLMMEGLLDYEVRIVNFGSEGDVHLSSVKYDRRLVFPCAGSNVERDRLPYPDAHFSVVVCAEVIEHLTLDPAHMLSELHRVLMPSGTLVLTTPNVLRQIYDYRSARDFAHGRNVHDFYSGYGPYGRHNREYTPAELETLVSGCGFSVTEIDVWEPDPPAFDSWRERFYPQLLAWLFRVDPREVERLRGSQITITARPGKERRAFRPDSLYKSTHALEKAREIFPRIP